MSQTSPGAGPPPLPPRPPACAHRADNTRMRGCLIAATAAVALAIGLAAILISISRASYHDYLARAAIAQVLADAAPLQPRLIAFVDAHGRCPTSEDPGFERTDVHAELPGEAGTQAGTCVIGLLLDDDRHSATHGRQLWLGYDHATRQWRCSADIEHRYLPAHCRD